MTGSPATSAGRSAAARRARPGAGRERRRAARGRRSRRRAPAAPAAAGRRRRSRAASPMPITSASATPSVRPPAQRELAAADRDLVLALLRHRHQVAVVVLAGDELVDEAAGGMPGAGDQLGADAVAVDRRGRRARRSRTRRGRWSPRSGCRSRPSASSWARTSRGERAQVAGVDADRAEPGAGDLDAEPRPPRGRRRCRPAASCPVPSEVTWARNASASVSCSSVKLCALVPAVGTPYRCAGGEVGGGGEPGDVRRAGAGDRRLLVRTSRAHLDARPVTGDLGHPGRRRGDRRVVVVDREQHASPAAPPRRRCPRRSAGASRGSRPRPRRSPRRRR